MGGMRLVAGAAVLALRLRCQERRHGSSPIPSSLHWCDPTRATLSSMPSAPRFALPMRAYRKLLGYRPRNWRKIAARRRAELEEIQAKEGGVDEIAAKGRASLYRILVAMAKEKYGFKPGQTIPRPSRLKVRLWREGSLHQNRKLSRTGWKKPAQRYKNK